MDPYNREGEPITLDEWASLLADRDYKIVEQTQIPETEILVSTVWLGIDHSFGYSDKPVLFETMVFGMGEEIQERWHTEDEARQGHRQILAKVLGTAVDPSNLDQFIKDNRFRDARRSVGVERRQIGS